MKKVGVMTWYRYRNYGTALQAAALLHIISQLGYEPFLIRHTPREPPIGRPALSVGWFLSKIRKKLYDRRHRPDMSPAREKRFSSFLGAYLRQTEACDTYPELYALNAEFDAFVCGSDQIWSPSCFDDKYFLSFVDPADRMIAYAPSFGLPEITDAVLRKKIQTLLFRFRHLSVREDRGAQIIDSLCHRKAPVVLDPTLLLPPGEWDTFVPPVERTGLPRGRYLLCYFLGDECRYKRTVSRTAKVLGLPVYTIPVFQKQKSANLPFAVGPAEFVDLIRNAGYLCTDSFHGMAFAIQYRIPFTAFKRFNDRDPQNQNSRVLSLLRLTGLQHRLAGRGAAVSSREQLLKLDFTEAARIIEEQRGVSLRYLRSALSDACAERSTEKAEGEYRITDCCAGCGMCTGICPRHAIQMQRDADGFLHYRIDPEKCVRCGRCRQICPFTRISAGSLKNAKGLYSLQSADPAVLRKSSSGGAAHELARLLNAGGYWVCGCTYDRERDGAKHILIEPGCGEKIDALQGSKYLQSETEQAVAGIVGLPEDAKLLFVGTPCQVAGVDHLLRSRKRRDSAVLVDLICHGVPSQLLWDKYLSEKEKEIPLSEHPEVEFRSKKQGWQHKSIELSDGQNRYLQIDAKDCFYAFFQYSFCNMLSCYECPYRERSAADIRLGDYWGPRFAKDQQGVSMVLTNSQSGERILRKLWEANLAHVARRPLQEYWDVQVPRNHPRPLFYDPLLGDLRDPEESIKSIRSRYCFAFETHQKFAKIKTGIKKALGKEGK